MAFKEVQLSSPIIDVGLCEDGSTLAVLRHDAVDIIEWGSKEGFEILQNSIMTDKALESSSRQIRFIDNNTVAVLSDQHGSLGRVEMYTKSENKIWTIQRTEDRTEGIISLSSFASSTGLLAATMDGTIAQLSLPLGFVDVTKLPEKCPWVEVHSTDDKVNKHTINQTKTRLIWGT